MVLELARKIASALVAGQDMGDQQYHDPTYPLNDICSNQATLKAAEAHGDVTLL